MDQTTLEALRAIERADPDGKETEPTDDDHARHRRWAIERYGQGIWRIYQQGSWAPTPDV